jgi:hypothetical protein
LTTAVRPITGKRCKKLPKKKIYRDINKVGKTQTRGKQLT